MRAESVLLEPVCRFEIGMPLDMLGKVSSDLSRLQADIGYTHAVRQRMHDNGRDADQLHANLRGGLLHANARQRPSNLRPDHSEPCRDAQSVIARKQYDPLSDPDQPPPPSSALTARASSSRGTRPTNGHTAKRRMFTRGSRKEDVFFLFGIAKEPKKSLLGLSTDTLS